MTFPRQERTCSAIASTNGDFEPHASRRGFHADLPDIDDEPRAQNTRELRIPQTARARSARDANAPRNMGQRPENGSKRRGSPNKNENHHKRNSNGGDARLRSESPKIHE